MSERGERHTIGLDDVGRFDRALALVPPRQGRLDRRLRQLIVLGARAAGWRLLVERAAPLPADAGRPGGGCVVVVAPHRAWVEPFLLVASWPTEAAHLVWLADGSTATRSWWRRRWLPRLGVIPIVGGADGPRRLAMLAARACRAGHAVVVFPEVGPPSPPDRARRLSPGFAYLALQAGAPIVPVVVGGTHRIARSSMFSLDFGAPLDPGPAMEDPFSPEGRERAHALMRRFDEHLASVLPRRTQQADAAAPSTMRWRWLGSLVR